MQREKNYGAQKLTVNFIEHTWECCSKGGEYFFQHLTSTLQGKKVAARAAGLLVVGGKRMEKNESKLCFGDE